MAGAVIAAAVLLAGVGVVPTRALVPSGGVAAMGLGLGIALVAALVGLVPHAVSGGDPRQRVGATLAGMLIRFVLLLGLLLPLLLSGRTAKAPLAVWAVIGYIMLLAVETIGIIWMDKATRSRS